MNKHSMKNYILKSTEGEVQSLKQIILRQKAVDHKQSDTMITDTYTHLSQRNNKNWTQEWNYWNSHAALSEEMRIEELPCSFWRFTQNNDTMMTPEEDWGLAAEEEGWEKGNGRI